MQLFCVLKEMYTQDVENVTRPTTTKEIQKNVICKLSSDWGFDLYVRPRSGEEQHPRGAVFRKRGLLKRSVGGMKIFCGRCLRFVWAGVCKVSDGGTIDARNWNLAQSWGRHFGSVSPDAKAVRGARFDTFFTGNRFLRFFFFFFAFLRCGLTASELDRRYTRRDGIRRLFSAEIGVCRRWSVLLCRGRG